MSVELIVEVLLHAPPVLTPAEKLLLTVIAESCNTKTRMTWYRDGWDAAEVARRSHLTVGSLSKTFWSLAQKGCEVRVAHGADKNGNPIFAHKGRQTTFRLPRFAPLRSDEDRTLADEAEAKGPTYVGVSPDQDRTLDAQRSDEDRTLLLKDLSSKNTSSLSPAEVEPSAAAIIPAQRSERENEESSQQETEPLTPSQKLIAKHGPQLLDEIQFVEGHIDSACGTRSAGFYITADRNGTLAALVAEARRAYTHNEPTQAERVCIRCDGHRSEWNGHYFTTTPCLACHGSGTHQDSSGRRCPEHPSHPIGCGLCRADRRASEAYIEQLNTQQRSSARTSMSPADQRVAEGAVLYRKYKAIEDGGHKPYRDPEDLSEYDKPFYPPRALKETP